MGTKRPIATAINGIHEMTVHDILEMIVHAPEAVDRQMAETTMTQAKMVMAVAIDGVVDLRMAEDPREEDREVHRELTAVPGLAPGSVKAKAENARCRTPSRFRHCRERRRIASHGFAPSTAPYR